MEWTMEHNIIFCREVLFVNPFKKKKGSVERGALWKEIIFQTQKLDITMLYSPNSHYTADEA
jgi:hypothetical protein